MRLLFEDLAYPSGNGFTESTDCTPDPGVRVAWINLINPKRDLYLQFTQPAPGQDITVDVYPSRDLVSGTRLTRAGVSPSAAAQTIVIDDSGIRIDVRGVFQDLLTTSFPVLWGYDSSYHLVTDNNMRTRLLRLGASGQALEGLRDDCVTIFDPSHIKAYVPLGINITPMTDERDEVWDASQIRSAIVPFEIDVLTSRMSRREDNASVCSRYAHVVASALADEYRQSFGEVLVTELVGVGNPAALSNDDGVAICTVSLRVSYHGIWRDDVTR